YDVNLRVDKGERIALLGTNGAGKSTILKAASGLLQPAAGAIRWKGDDTRGIAAERLVRMGLGHVPGGRGLFPTLTVEANLRLGGYVYDAAARVNSESDRAIHYFPSLGDRFRQAAGPQRRVD